MTNRTELWLGFALVMTVIFIVDMGMFSRKSHEVKFREALAWTLVWVALAFAFNVWVYIALGQVKALEFLTGYLIEESLSVDNLFVFIMIFSYFRISRAHQPKILKWGILGALIMRGAMIAAGVALLAAMHRSPSFSRSSSSRNTTMRPARMSSRISGMGLKLMGRSSGECSLFPRGEKVPRRGG